MDGQVVDACPSRRLWLLARRFKLKRNKKLKEFWACLLVNVHHRKINGWSRRSLWSCCQTSFDDMKKSSRKIILLTFALTLWSLGPWGTYIRGCCTAFMYILLDAFISAEKWIAQLKKEMGGLKLSENGRNGEVENLPIHRFRDILAYLFFFFGVVTPRLWMRSWRIIFHTRCYLGAPLSLSENRHRHPWKTNREVLVWNCQYSNVVLKL